MKLYAFSTGTISSNNEEILENAPIQCFLIDHPRGIVLVDTGIDPVTSDNPKLHWGKLAHTYTPQIDESESIVRQIKNLGYSNEYIDYVVMTHMHMDHAGCLRWFPYSSIIVNKKEKLAAQKQGSEDNCYLRRDWDYPLQYTLIEKSKDIFGDEKVIVKPLPGHTDGMQVVIVELENKKVVLASDAAAREEFLHEDYIPVDAIDKSKYSKSIKYLKKLSNEGALVICGHDNEQWSTIKKVPDYYE